MAGRSSESAAVTASHGKTGEVARLSIPFHGTRSLKAGLQSHPMKVAGLTDADVD